MIRHTGQMVRNPVGDRGLHSRVVGTLGQNIVDGDLEPGTVLNLVKLSERFSVSRSVLREALRVLQSLGMVEPRQRIGTLVLPRTEWDVMNPQVIAWRGHSHDYFDQMRELLELRLGLEPTAADLAADNATRAQLSTIVRCAELMVDAAGRGDERLFLEADVELHTVVLQGSRNTMFAHFASTVEAVLRTRTEERRRTITDYTPASAKRHLELARALFDRDGPRAQRWSREMLTETLAEFEREGVERA